MKDYAVQIKIKNNWFLQRMYAAGFERVADLSRASGIDSSRIGQLVNLKSIPTIANGNEQWRPIVLRLSDAMKCLPEDLFPPQHISKPLKRNTAIIELSAEEIPALLANSSTFSLPPSANMDLKEAHKNINMALLKLSPKQHRVIALRYGLDGKEPQTLEEVASSFGLTRARIQQIEGKAIRRLRGRGATPHGPLLDAMKTFSEQEGGAA